MLELKKTPIDPPPHPGKILKRDFIDPMGISVTELSARLGVSRNTISSIVNERSGVSADMALRFARAFKTQPELWLKLEFAFELWEAQQFDSGWKEVEPIKSSKNTPFRGNASKQANKMKRVPRHRQ
jgi:addiction module HigA family antidote